MSELFWDGKIEMWEPESLDHLIYDVWKIKNPINIIDVGCGIGFVGVMFLPALPEKSNYTGIDSASTVIKEANATFDTLPYNATFVEGDIATFKHDTQYDIAFCQMMSYSPHIQKIIGMIKPHVKKGGKIICIEADNDKANAALYFDGLDSKELESVMLLNKYIGRNTINDKYVGLKSLVYMQEAGLQDIHIMVSDSSNYLSHTTTRELFDHDVERFLRNPALSEQANKNAAINLMLESGMTREAAESEYNRKIVLDDYIRRKINTICMMEAKSLYLTYATV